MAQEFPCVCADRGAGQFRLGHGDPPAAMRYTEVRLQKVASLVDDLDKDTPSISRENYDELRKGADGSSPAGFRNCSPTAAGGIAGWHGDEPFRRTIWGELIDALIAIDRQSFADDRGIERDYSRPGFFRPAASFSPCRHSRWRTARAAARL